VQKKRRPVEEYLKMQGRFEHLFKPARQDQVLQTIQGKVDEYWAKVVK
jgi:pyruvate ferredoxin oxidoreductase beta subunit